MTIINNPLLKLLLLAIIACTLFSCTGKRNSENKTSMDIKSGIITGTFGSVDGEEVKLYTLTNSNGMVIKVTNYGGIVTSIQVPDRDTRLGDVALGFDELQPYLDGHPYFGCIVGRYGNRIANAGFELDGQSYILTKNNGENSLHGGDVGFDKKIWEAETFESEKGVGLQLHYLSPDMEEGYPGNLDVYVTYLLTDENEIIITYKATTDKACPVNLTWHGYFNLTEGRENVKGHQILINADKYVVVDENIMPTGELRSTQNTPMDFSDFHTIGERFDQVEGGYDHSYVLVKDSPGLTLVARVHEPKSGRLMEVYTTEPGVQFYAGNFLDGTLTGRNGVVYNSQYGFCLEAQHFPDSPNQPGFPNSILRPGEVYAQTTIYRFSVK